VADDGGLLDASLLHEGEDDLGLCRRGIVPLGAVGPAEALEIEGEDPVGLAELGDEEIPGFEGGGEAVDEDDRGALAHVDIADARSLDLGKAGRLRLALHRSGVEGEAAGEEGSGEEDRQYLHGESRVTSAAVVNSSLCS
jgi:hypothetical protein